MLRFINSLTKEIIIDDGDLLLCDFKNSNITFLYSNDECYFIDNDIKIIGSEAFSNNTSLFEIEIPGSVEKIEYSAFSQCTCINLHNHKCRNSQQHDP